MGVVVGIWMPRFLAILLQRESPGTGSSPSTQYRLSDPRRKPDECWFSAHKRAMDSRCQPASEADPDAG